VWTINTGQAYSGGFMVFIAGHRRISYPNASFLIHEGATGTMGDANKFNNWADFYKKILNRLKTITLKYTNISKEEYEKHQKDDWWFFAEDALEMGICDEISDSFM
jgi:ATP-dependent Clp protease protease subunit